MSTPHRRCAFTLIEMLVVIGIILALAALAAAFMPRVNDSQNMSRAVDNFQQWLLTAKMRAKRDGLVTGIRFVQAQGDAPGQVSTFQYVQQPEPLSGGYSFVPNPSVPPPPSPYQYPPGSGIWYTGGLLTEVASAPGTGSVAIFAGVDFTLGSAVGLTQPLVQAGDYLEINGGGPHQILQAFGATNVKLVDTAYSQPLRIDVPTTNYRILRQPRVLIGEEPLTLPNNYAAHFQQIPGSSSALSGTNVIQSPSGYWEILFSPGGAVVGASAAAPSGHVYVSLWDSTMDTPDINRVGIVGVRVSSGFIGAYAASPGADPFYWMKTARESGM